MDRRARRLRPTLIALLSIGACGARNRDVDRGAAPAPAPAPTSPPAPTAAAPIPAPPSSPSTCKAPFVVPPPYPEPWIDAAAASPPYDLGPWSTRAMAGPFATRDLAAPGCTDEGHATAAAPFDDVIQCATGDRMRGLGPDNIPAHLLLVRTGRGWWSHPLVRDYWPHGDRDDEARVATVDALTTADLVGDAGAELTAITEDGPPGGDKTRRVFICGVGPSTTPSCVGVRVAAKGPFHGAGALLYRLDLTCDGTLSIAGWEGGAPVKLVHGRGRLTFP